MYYVYILASDSKSLYTGSSGELLRRLVQHRTGLGAEFTAHYKIHKLVFFELAATKHAALARERQIKSWRREKKIALIERHNPDWRDLAIDWLNPPKMKR